MFRLYLAGASVFGHRAKGSTSLGWRNKQWTTQDGKLYGGSPLRRGHIYNLLGNILYTGQFKVGDEIFPGEHEAIIDEQTFDLVQARLKQNCRDSRQTTSRQDGRAAARDALLLVLWLRRCTRRTRPAKSAAIAITSAIGRNRRLEGYCTSRSVSAPVRRGRGGREHPARQRSSGRTRGNRPRFAGSGSRKQSPACARN